MDLVEGLERALMRFESTSNHAVLRLYRKSDLISASVTAQGEAFMSASSSSWKTDGEKEKEGNIFTQGDNEHVFLVYLCVQCSTLVCPHTADLVSLPSFIFTLQEFARELVSLVDAMERIYSLEQERVHRGPWWKRIFSGIWGLLKRPFSKSKPKRHRRPPAEHPSLRRKICMSRVSPWPSFYSMPSRQRTSSPPLETATPIRPSPRSDLTRPIRCKRPLELTYPSSVKSARCYGQLETGSSKETRNTPSKRGWLPRCWLLLRFLTRQGRCLWTGGAIGR